MRVHREEPREWLVAYLVLSCDQKQVVVGIDGTRKPYSINKVKIYNEPVPEAPVTTSEVQPTAPESSVLGSILDDIIGGNVFFTKLRENIEREIQSEHITDRAVIVVLTDVLKPGDPREDTQESDDAKQNEIDGLLALETFCPVREDIPENANILAGSFVCTLRNVGTENEKPKARYFDQGHKDKEKPFTVHNITTLRSSSVKIIVSTTAVRDFRLFSHDVTQAYLQNDEEMSREIYLRRKEGDRKYFRVTGDVLLQMLRALYGVTDASDYWGVTLDKQIKDDLSMVPTDIDPSLYI